jgi:hypothetical protein
LHASDRTQRVELYARLVQATFTAVTLVEPPRGPEEVQAALAFWNGIFR